MVQNNVILRFARDPLPSPLGVKIGGLFWQFIMQAVIDLIKKSRNLGFMLVLNFNFALRRNGIGK